MGSKKTIGQSGYKLTTELRWLAVIPMFLFVLLFMGGIFKYVVDRTLFYFLTLNTSLQLKFVLNHIYDDYICIVMAILAACYCAPRYRIGIAIGFMILVFILTPSFLNIDKTHFYYGERPWKMPFLIATYISAAVTPVIVMVLRERRQRRLEEAEAAEPPEPESEHAGFN